MYTKEEMDEAVSVIAETFFEANPGFEMQTIRHALDDCTSRENPDRLNQLSGRRKPYTQCIAFVSDLYPSGDREGYTNYEWWLARTDGGEWRLVTYGG